MAHEVKCFFVISLLCVFNVLCVLLLLFCLLQSDSGSIQLKTFSSVSALESHLEVQNRCYLRFIFGLTLLIYSQVYGNMCVTLVALTSHS